MTLWTMLLREMAYRKLNSLFGLLGVAGAAALLVGVLLSLEIHAARSGEIVRRKEAETQAAMAALQSDVRKAMHHLGYNAIVLPKDQSLSDWYTDEYAKKMMPETSCSRLEKTRGLVDRYLPRLRQKLYWKEKKWTIIVVGVGREHILDTSVSPDTPLVDTIAPGHCEVGYELHQAQNLHPGDVLTVSGKQFKISKCEKERGTQDDITLWLNLADAQQLLGQPGKINEILLVEHLNVWGRLNEVQQRIDKILPGCQVIELASETLSRAHARVKVADEARAAIEREEARRAMLQAERSRIARRFVPLGMLVCILWVGIQMVLNVRERAEEIGVLMSQGFRAGAVRMLILSKAALQGLVGGAVGFFLGAAAAVLWEGIGGAPVPLAVEVGIEYLGFAVAISVIACLVGSWLPAWMALRTDPAVVLRRE